MHPAIESSFKGHPILEMKAKAEDKYGLTIGMAKARLILDHLDEIRAFVAKHDKKEAA